MRGLDLAFFGGGPERLGATPRSLAINARAVGALFASFMKSYLL
jgi:hypothetical protein